MPNELSSSIDWLGLLTCPWFLATAGFVIGACLGRLANRCIDVFPRHVALSDQIRAIWTFSPHEQVLRAFRSPWHRLPVIGWLLPGNPLAQARGGKRYAAIELANGIIVALLACSRTPEALAWGSPGDILLLPADFAVEGWEMLAPPAELSAWLVRLLLHVVLVEALLIASVIDLQWMIIPDGSTIPPMVLAVALMTIAGDAWLVPVWYEHSGLVAVLTGSRALFGGGIVVPAWVASSPHWHGLLVSVGGLIVGGGTVWAVRLIGSWALGREAMGFGDVILMALVGSVVGWQPALAVFFLAPLCALVVLAFSFITGRMREFPYGPWLSLATLVLLVGWSQIWPAVGRFFLLGRIVPIFGLACLVLLGVLLWGMRLLRGEEEGYWEWVEYYRANSHAGNLCPVQSQSGPAADYHSWRAGEAAQWPGLESARGRHGEQMWRGGSESGWS